MLSMAEDNRVQVVHQKDPPRSPCEYIKIFNNKKKHLSLQ